MTARPLVAGSTGASAALRVLRRIPAERGLVPPAVLLAGEPV